MFINKYLLGRRFREESNGDGGEGGGSDESKTETSETKATEESSTAPDWLQGKYVTEGKSQEESITEQAKAYNELSSKFGAFTGAPENYEVAFSDELKEAGIELNNEDPLVKAATEFAKKSGMNQDGFNEMLNLVGMQKLADAKAMQEVDDQFATDQMKALGPDAESRITNITEWANKHLDAEDIKGLEAMTSTAESVKAIERLISMTRGASVDIDNSQSNSGASAEEVKTMQFEKDSHGNRRINSDPAFKAKYLKLRDEVHGSEEHKQMVG